MRSAVTLLLDRDGTIVRDDPYNNDPARLQLVAGVTDALTRVRARGISIALVTNQSAIARGLATTEQVDEFNRALSVAVGGFDIALVCPHIDGCGCRKPAPGLLFKALEILGGEPSQAVMVGDIGSDIQAAQAAGVHSILVPTEQTLRDEISSAPVVRSTFADAMAAVCAFHDTGRLG